MERIDATMMRRALRLAERARGKTSPNPPVGAVLVREGQVVGQGFHRAPGEAHAEIEAIAAAGHHARGSTLYVTLEPCTRTGRTPPCVPAVVDAGVARVVLGVADPNPEEDGRGIAALRAAGLTVDVGVLEHDARHLVLAFAKHVRTGRPLLTAKAAVTIDGRVAAADGSSRWITGPTARRDAHRLRASVDAVMVGAGTVAKDDPALTVRLRGYTGRKPLRVVLDSTARTPPDAAVVSPDAPTLIAVTDKASEDAVHGLAATGAEVTRFPGRDGRVDLESVLDELGRRGLCEVLLEGGPTVLGDAVERRLVDRYVFYVAPKLLGTSGTGLVTGLVVPHIDGALELQFISVRHIGADLRIEAYPRR